MALIAKLARPFVAMTTCLMVYSSAACSTMSTGTPGPKIEHMKIRRQDVNRKLLIVGDVHGCFDEFLLMLEKVKFDDQTHTVVLVGDLINKGPKSVEMVQWARERNALCVRGNHEDALLEAKYRVGRFAKETPHRYDYMNRFTDEDWDYVLNMPLSIHMPWLKKIVVHAGVVPRVPLEDQRFLDLTKLRCCTKANDVYEGHEQLVEDSTLWAKLWDGPEHVYFGHDAKRGLQMEAFATGLDTGCCYGNVLSAVLVDADGEFGDELVQITALNMYTVPKHLRK